MQQVSLYSLPRVLHCKKTSKDFLNHCKTQVSANRGEFDSPAPFRQRRINKPPVDVKHEGRRYVSNACLLAQER